MGRVGPGGRSTLAGETTAWRRMRSEQTLHQGAFRHPIQLKVFDKKVKSQMPASKFNSSIWNALWVLSPLGIAVFFVCFFSLEKGSHYFFDPKHNVDKRLKDELGDYEPHSNRYQELAKLAITLSAAAIAFLINIVASEKPVLPAFSQRVQLVAPIVCGF